MREKGANSGTGLGALKRGSAGLSPFGIMSLSIFLLFCCIGLFSLFIDYSMSGYMRAQEEEYARAKARSAAQFVQALAGDLSSPHTQKRVNQERFLPLQSEIGRLAENVGSRITIISESGIVLADSDMSVYQLLNADNHAERSEVRAALETGTGVSERSSPTLGVDYLYYAVRFERAGETLISRVAVDLESLYLQQTRLRQLLTIGMVFGIALVGLITFSLARALARSVEHSRKRLEARVTERTATLRQLQELGTLLAVCNSLSEASEVLAVQLPQLPPGTRGALSLMNNSRDMMIVEQEWGGRWTKGSFVSPGSCWSLRKNSMHWSEDNSLVCDHLKDEADKDVLCVPLIAQGDILGVIHLCQKAGGAFGNMELEIAQAISKEAAIALSNLNLRETLEQQALHDPLTGLHNRRFLEEKFDTFIEKATRADQNFWLLVVDIDHFKTYNDKYGHDAGDFVLVELATLFRKSIRNSFTACRLGGEEFALLLPDLDEAKALEFAEQLRRSVENMRLRFEGQPLGQITISGGLAGFPKDGSNLSSILRPADERLYHAKGLGRNRICKDLLVDELTDPRFSQPAKTAQRH